MNNNKRKPIFNLDPEEQDISDSFDQGEMKTVDNLQEEFKKAKETAANTLALNEEMKIRISKPDLLKLKEEAAYAGIPPETLAASVIHKYAAGHLT